MNDEEMKRRLEEGESPLELSIEKWQDIVNGTGECFGPSNCALCYVHASYNSKPLVVSCEDCPVSKAGHPCCTNTPYEEYETAYANEDKDAMKEHAKKELVFLISLRPKELGAKTQTHEVVCDKCKKHLGTIDLSKYDEETANAVVKQKPVCNDCMSCNKTNKEKEP